jgi:UDP-N-acetylmuramoyl-tripeptide--D-alanyl-D-alanine ligase
VALRGEKFDGHAFVRQAAEAGAAGAVVEDVEEAPGELPEGFAVIKVGDTLKALQCWPCVTGRRCRKGDQYHRQQREDIDEGLYRGGAVGARTCCEDGGKFEQSHRAAADDPAGVAADEFGVFEIGMNHPGEIAPLARISRPDAGVITNIGVAHIEFMGSQEAIALEKGMLAEAVGAEGFVVLPVDDAFTESIAARTQAKVIRAGLEHGDVYASDVSGGRAAEPVRGALRKGARRRGRSRRLGGTWWRTRCWRWRWGWSTGCRWRRASRDCGGRS